MYGIVRVELIDSKGDQIGGSLGNNHKTDLKLIDSDLEEVIVPDNETLIGLRVVIRPHEIAVISGIAVITIPTH